VTKHRAGGGGGTANAYYARNLCILCKEHTDLNSDWDGYNARVEAVQLTQVRWWSIYSTRQLPLCRGGRGRGSAVTFVEVSVRSTDAARRETQVTRIFQLGSAFHGDRRCTTGGLSYATESSKSKPVGMYFILWEGNLTRKNPRVQRNLLHYGCLPFSSFLCLRI
jgi:hypothetical protein